MNQILYIEKSKNSGSADFNKIAKISVIVIIIFAVFLILLGIIGIINSSNEKNATEPQVEAKQDDNYLEVKITHDKAIDKIVYTWNGQDEVTLQGRGQTEMTELLEMPEGNSVLQLVVTDIDKKQTTFSQTYYVDDTVDSKKPEIELKNEGSKIKIVVRDNKELQSVSYYWNNEDWTSIEIRDDSKKQIEEKIDILKGRNTLTVIARDAFGNEEVKEQVYNAAKAPKLTLDRQDDKLIINASDEIEIQKIEVIQDGQVSSTDSNNTGESLQMQEVVIEYPLVLREGENVIKVVVYNTNELTKEDSITITK